MTAKAFSEDATGWSRQDLKALPIDPAIFAFMNRLNNLLYIAA